MRFSDAISTALLLVTAVYVALQFYILRAMRDALLLTNQSISLARMDLRPWVAIRDFGVTGKTTTFVASTQVTFEVLLKNTGKSPAFIRSAGTHADFTSTIPATIPNFSPPASAPILSPDDEHLLEVIIPARAQGDWSAIGANRLHLIVYIVVRYADVHGVEHETTSAHELRQTGAGTYRWSALPNLGSMT